jgi:hypothetical protein
MSIHKQRHIVPQRLHCPSMSHAQGASICPNSAVAFVLVDANGPAAGVPGRDVVGLGK